MSEDFLTRFSELTKTFLIVSEQDKAQIDQLLFTHDTANTPPIEAIEVLVQSMSERTLNDLEYNQETNVGVIPITGMLTDRYDPIMDYYVGITAYETVLQDAKTMLDAGANRLVLYIDSGGGQAYNMMTSARELREMVDEYGAELISYNDGSMASAAYGLGSVSHKVYAHPDAGTGSIGAVISLTDYSELYTKAGIKRHWITAGEGKVPYNKDGSFSESFLTDLKAKVDVLYGKFTSHTSEFRGIPIESVVGLGANMYMSEDALEAGLIDGVMSRSEFVSHIQELSLKEKKGGMKLFTSTKDKQMSKPEELQTALALAKADFEIELQSQIDGLKTKLSAEFESKLSAKDAELNTALEALKEVAKEKAEAKTANRKATLAAIVGDVQAEAKAAKMADLSDEAFAGMVEMLQSMSAEADKSVLNTELGDEGQEVVAAPVDAVTAYREKTKARYEQKYNKKGAK